MGNKTASQNSNFTPLPPRPKKRSNYITEATESTTTVSSGFEDADEIVYNVPDGAAVAGEVVNYRPNESQILVFFYATLGPEDTNRYRWLNIPNENIKITKYKLKDQLSWQDQQFQKLTPIPFNTTPDIHGLHYILLFQFCLTV